MVIIEKAELIHIKELILRGQYNDALIILKSIKNWERKLTTEEKETIQILLSIALMKLGDYKRSMKVARQIFSRAQKNQDIVLSLEAIIIISKIMNIHEKIDEGLVWVEKGEEYARQLIEQKKEEMNLLLAQYFMVKGIFLCKSSNFVDSWVHFSQALTLTENFKINDVKADVLNYVAYHYFSRGKMDLALEANHQSLEIWEKIENKFAIAEIKNDLAEILIIQGDIHLALEIFQEGIEIALLNSDKRLIAKYQFNIGLVYEQKHDFEKALDWHLRSMNSFQETDNNRKISKVFYHIISTQVNLGKLEEAENYFRQFTKLDESTNDELIHQWFLLSMALLYTYKSNFMNLGKVEEIYSELINQKEYDKQITIYVLLNLSKLQLDYLMKIENKGLLIDLERNLAKLEEIADMEDSFSLFIEVYLLQAQVAVLNENMQKAQELLTQARSLAQIKELDNLGTETSNVYNVLATKVEIWEKLLRFNSSLTDLLELTPYEKGLKQIAAERIVEKKPEKIEEPILILVQDPGGTSMYSKKFLPDSEFDEQLISAFLFAINKFMQETFAGKGTVERITYLDYTILFKPIEPLLICYAYKGESYTAQQNIERFTDHLLNSPPIWKSLIEYTETGFVPEIENLIILDEFIDEVFSPQTQDLTNILDDDYIKENLDDILKSKL